MKNKAYIIATLLYVLAITSCTPVAKLITGVRNPKYYVPNNERIEYYKPFYEAQQSKINIYTLSDPGFFKKTFDSLHVPRIYVQNTKTNMVYVLDCYEDIAANVEDINNKKFEEVTIADKKEFDYFKKFIATNTVLSYSNTTCKANKDWDVYMINGTFMGKKMRKRSLPISGINNLNEIIVLDVSINKEPENSN